MVRIAERERARPEWLRSHPRAWWAAVATVCFGAFMGQLDASVVALTYRTIGRDFHAPLTAVQSISLTYLAVLALMLLPTARLSDRIGRKRVYLWGFGAFTVSSAACAFAPSLPALAALRALQGGAAAMLQANSVAIVATAAPPRRLRRALGVQAAAQALGLALGPVVGGVLVHALGWRWVFGVNVPIGVVAMLAGSWLLPRTRLSDEAPPGVRAVLRARSMLRGLAGALLAYLLLFGPIVLVPVVLQEHGRSALAAGLATAALPAGFAGGGVAGERLLPRRSSARSRCATGLIVCAVGLGGLLASGPSVTSWAGALAVIGVGLGIFTPANNAEIMSAAPSGAAAVAGGLLSGSRAAGTAAGTAIVAGTIGILASGAAAVDALLGVVVLALAVSGCRSGRAPAGRSAGPPTSSASR